MRLFQIQSVSKISAVILSLSAGVPLALTTGCGAFDSEAVQGETGSASVVIAALGASDAAGATISVTAADIATPISAPLANSNGKWGATLSGIPAGSNRIFTLSATDASGAERYNGQAAGVTISANQTQEVVILAQQTSASTGFSDSAPVIDLLQASSANVTPGATVNLRVTAHDPDANDTLSYAWSSGSGALSNPSMPSTTWTAPSATGTYSVLVAVRDSQQESVTSSVQITVSSAPPPVPIPASARWALAGLLAAAGVISLNVRMQRLGR